MNAEGVLYDLNKLQKSLFNSKKSKEFDPVLVQKMTEHYPNYFKKVAVRYRRQQENSLAS